MLRIYAPNYCSAAADKIPIADGLLLAASVSCRDCGVNRRDAAWAVAQALGAWCKRL